VTFKQNSFTHPDFADDVHLFARLFKVLERFAAEAAFLGFTMNYWQRFRPCQISITFKATYSMNWKECGLYRDANLPMFSCKEIFIMPPPLICIKRTNECLIGIITG